MLPQALRAAGAGTGVGANDCAVFAFVKCGGVAEVFLKALQVHLPQMASPEILQTCGNSTRRYEPTVVSAGRGSASRYLPLGPFATCLPPPSCFISKTQPNSGPFQDTLRIDCVLSLWEISTRTGLQYQALSQHRQAGTDLATCHHHDVQRQASAEHKRHQGVMMYARSSRRCHCFLAHSFCGTYLPKMMPIVRLSFPSGTYNRVKE
mmetsp:Transcript_2265/g.5230  ORF Transcript_2265/g.5230 Transcript_2265/m.5230 type:complete len:207 (-) Transcript_2265:373-993(-)